MATLLSNELKAVVVPDNFLDNPINVLKENCLTVQHFDYECEHKRNDSGEVYGANERMSGYDDGMVVDGYVVHVEETYTTKVDDNGDKQMMLNVTLQVRSVIYLGRENNFKSTFIE